jgi:hypothetical protein
VVIRDLDLFADEKGFLVEMIRFDDTIHWTLTKEG